MTRPRVTLAAGVLVGLAFAVLRLSAAEELGDALLAVGFSLLEIGALFLADQVIARYRDAESAWRNRASEAADAVAQRDASAQEYDRLVTAKGRAREQIERHLRYVDTRGALSGDANSREDAFVLAIVSGYYAGIAVNTGRTQR